MPLGDREFVKGNSMRRNISIWIVVCSITALIQTSVIASGSIRPGGAISPRDAYTQGKALTFQKLVCATCPISKGELDRDRAISLKNSLEARDESAKPVTSDDEHIKVLDRDEQEMVHYYLKRRYKL